MVTVTSPIASVAGSSATALTPNTPQTYSLAEGDYLQLTVAALNERYGEEYALRIMAACGVDRWEDLDGRKLNVLLDAPFPWGRAIGIAGEGERGGPFIFADLQAEYGVAHSGTSAPGYTRPHPLH